ncbi:MAG: hypothetical protein ACRCW1_07140, partial [Anaerotignaceae bacterium]
LIKTLFLLRTKRWIFARGKNKGIVKTHKKLKKAYKQAHKKLKNAEGSRAYSVFHIISIGLIGVYNFFKQLEGCLPHSYPRS